MRNSNLGVNFDAQAALSYAKSISRPRLVGSEGEKSVAEYLIEKLRGFGLKVVEEEFVFSTALWTYSRVFLILSIMIILTSYVLLEKFPLVVVIPSSFLLLGTLLSGYIARWILSASVEPQKPFKLLSGHRYRSSNIVARLSSPKEDRESKKLYLLAHYDSKSQYLPLAIRIVLISIVMGGNCIISLFFILSGLNYSSVPDPAVTILCIVTIASALLLFSLKVENRSPGAIDNASGVGLLLHLAQILSQSRETLKTIDVTLVATGAEEFGVVGAFAFYKAHSEEFVKRRQDVYILNFDGTGVDGRIYTASKIGLRSPKGDGNLSRIVKEAAEELSLEVHFPPVVIGTMADHFPFVMKGLDAVTFSVYSRSSLSVHTPKDTLSKLDPEGLRKVGMLACRVIEKLIEVT